MEKFFPLLITTGILLLPLIPAGFIYFLLTPKSQENKNEAKGEYEGQFLELGQIKIKFSVFGSTASYVLFLFVAFYIHTDIETKEIKRLSIKDQTAWLVEVPVRLKNSEGTPYNANNGEMQQVMITLEPGNIEASASMLQFWVVPEKGRFPTANFSLPGIMAPETLDLNDSKKISYNHGLRKMESIVPVWLEIGEAYEQ